MAGLTAAELEAVVGVDDSPFSKGLDAMLGKFSGWGGKATAILGGIGAVGGGLFAAGLASGMNLADVRAQIQSELGVTAQEAERLGGVAGDLYANAYGDSLEETANAVTTVVSSIKGMRKATDEQVNAMTAKAMVFADVFEVDIARATQVAGQAVKSGLAGNATEAFDLLTATMQRVPKNVREDIMDAADEYGPFFATLGIKGEQAFGMLAQGAKKGMFGIDKTGDALKEFTIRATDGSEATQGALEKIGLNGKKMANDLLAGGDKGAAAFDKIVGGLNDMKNPLAQSKAALALFGTPLEDLGTQDLPKFLKGLEQGSKGVGDFAGATDKMVQATGSTPRANITQLWRTIQQGTVSALGGALIPALTTVTAMLAGEVGPAIVDAAGWFANAAAPIGKVASILLIGLGPALSLAAAAAQVAGSALEWFGGFVADNATPIGIVAGLIAAVFIPHLIALGVQSLVSGAKSVAGWVMSQAGAVAAAAVHSVTVAGMVAGWVVMGAQSMLQGARMAAAWLIAMGPVGWVIAALIAVGAGLVVLWKKSETFRSVVKGAFNAVAAAGRWLWNNALQPVFSSIVGGIAWLLEMWAKMLHGLAKVPGFGWADKAADAMDAAAGKARSMADGIKKIPDHKDVKVNVDYYAEVHGKHPSGPGYGAVPFATGGRVTSPTYAMIGEGREAESVLPDSVLRGLLERAHDSGARARDGDRGLMRDVVFNGREGASAREIIGELTHALRVADHGGVYA